MSRINSKATYTCDECNATVSEDNVISFKVSCPMAGHSAVASFESEQVYGCCSEHAINALVKSLYVLETLRMEKVEKVSSEESKNE